MATVPINVLFEIIGLIAVIGGVYVTLTNRITRIEERMEERQKSMEREQHSISKKIDGIQDTLGEVLIKMENKANR